MTNKTEMGSEFAALTYKELAERIAHYLSSALVSAQYSMTDETMHDALGLCDQVTRRKSAPAEDVRAVMEEPVGKYSEVLGPFTRLMERELHSNAYKGDRPAWLKMSAGECLLEIYYHAGKLHKAVHGGDCAGMQEYAADVANLSMMLTDITGALALFAKDAVEELNK